eukprot:TRINITY_DN40919_c0_g1_i1.p1 TRINITY_DN40919_c0_g1~~TRINITY_DN40919_c0_g1_i1.p1  ORF type:complete len:360 (-),score=55.10 TRINITY_DN40919_c0_g1_i1:272-1351(-)
MAVTHSSPRFIMSSFFGDSVACGIQSSTHLSFRYGLKAVKLSRKRQTIIFSRKFSGLKDFFLKRRVRELDESEWPHKYSKLKRGIVSPPLPVPDHILKPPYVNSKRIPNMGAGPQIHDAEGILRMRASGQLAARVLEFAGTLVKPGIKTDEIDKAVHKMIIDAGAYPSPLGYGGFPKSVCTSVNECICHGIPDSRPLQDGDIVNIDVTVYLDGYHGDTSKTFPCGNISKDANQLIKVTEECLHKAINICGPGVEFKKIGFVINEYADKFNYGIVEQFVGHGVGKVFHSSPTILHFRNNFRGRMKLGQTFTIEPMLTAGKIDHITWDDNWTVVTADGSLSAQFEHTLLITEDGAEILTQP